MNYIELNIELKPFQPWNEIFMTELSSIGFESFTEFNGKLQAYIPEGQFQQNEIERILQFYEPQLEEVCFQFLLLPSQNWNAKWEADFQPVEIDHSLLIRAPFHPPSSKHQLELIIQPQMSFGTGHHQTTWLLSKALLQENLVNKKVLDVGTGTGVLAILSSKLGARQIVGTDIEAGICANAQENCMLNELTNIEIVLGDIIEIRESGWDVIIANINKNVLKLHLPHYSSLNKAGGQLYLSGFFTTDIEELTDCAILHGYELLKTYQKEGWAVMKLLKQ
jgi:ribosomal protein L11 methyltransferase